MSQEEHAAKKRRTNMGKLTKSESSFLDEMLQGDTAQASKAGNSRDLWQRPPVKKFDPETESLGIILRVSTYISVRVSVGMAADPYLLHVVFQQMEVDEYMDYKAQMPVVRFYGITETGNSVICHVTGFLMYFYVPAPPGFKIEHIPAFQTSLEASMEKGNSIAKVEWKMKESIYGYFGGEKSPFLKITVKDPKHISAAKRSLERGISFAEFDDFSPPVTFENNISYMLRFMIDCKVTGANWIELPSGSYSLRSDPKSNAQINAEISYDKMISHQPEGEWSKIAPLRILSFDIECAGRKGVFPEAKVDPVIQIASMVTIQGETKPLIRNIIVLNTCANIVGTDIISCDQEEELLSTWAEFVRTVDPDVITGYNISNFDFPYLLDRAKHLGVNKFPFLGRLNDVKTEIKETKFSSKAYGTRESKAVNMEGRLQMDMIQVMQRDYKLRSYTLNAVCAEFLGEQKEDVHHSIITDLQNGNEETRRRLAIYCLKDAYLPQRLMDKLMCLINYIEMARVTGIPFNYILVRGQQIKVISQLYRNALEKGFVIPAENSQGTDEAYEGATVINPQRGYYNVPIATLDFASLYPSIMMAHNLCYTTLLKPEVIQRFNLIKDIDYVVTPNKDLLDARKRAKADLKKETDPFKRAVLDGRQLALKISANSVYGFTGATVGKLPCLEISSSVTAYGRDMIEKTKAEVELEYTVENGYKHTAEVIYGDTDSVMVKFGVETLEETMELGRKAAEYVTTKFEKPIKLEFEKVYYPYLLINKKRYAGLYWTKPDKHDKLDAKGIESVRRDNCRLVQTVIDTCLRKMLIDRDVQGAQDYVKRVISDLLQNKIDMAQLVITKALSKTDYANKQPHVVLAERMRKRDPGSAPGLGDRVAYVLIKAAKNTPAYDKSEDPLYVLKNKLPIDTRYYLDNQLSKPLLRIFEPILGGEEKAKTLLGGLMRFAVKTETCLGCKAPLRQGESAVCKNCKDRAPELYQKQQNIMNDLEVQFSRLWTQCQRCQGSLHQEVLCSSKDCPIYYMRMKVQTEIQDSSATLDRFLDW
ncbi:DNA-directed DNA polymerase delta [Mortierella sp. GBA43]|nr:DNA-directed DNA polymerase delta [Mortierella sp. GBA43]